MTVIAYEIQSQTHLTLSKKERKRQKERKGEKDIKHKIANPLCSLSSSL